MSYFYLLNELINFLNLFETGYGCVQVILEPRIFQPLDSWGYRHALPYPAFPSAFMNNAAINVQIV